METIENNNEEGILTLYKYFSYAASMRDIFKKTMNIEEMREWLNFMEENNSAPYMFLFFPPGIYMMYSYSGIYLVIEGWKDLKFKDEKIDKLLESPFVDRLRLFRNATFHYQKDITAWKHFQFFGTEEEKTEKWINELYSEFSKFFSKNTLPLPDILEEAIKDKSHVKIARKISEYWSSKEK